MWAPAPGCKQGQRRERPSDRHAVLLEPLDDRQGAEGGRLDQGTVDLRGGGVERLPDDKTTKERID